MSLSKIVATLSLALSLSAIAPNFVQGQNQLATSTPPSKPSTEISETNKGLPKPKGEPHTTLSVRIQTETFLGYTPPIGIGTVELRDKSLYATFLFDYYQLLFEQINDSVFVEHLFNNSIRIDLERYEIFTMVKRKNELVLIDYKVPIGTERSDKRALVNKSYSSEYIPTTILINNYFNNNLEQKVNLVVFGLPYTFKTHKTTDKGIITTYADMSEVPKDPNDKLLLEKYISLSSKKNSYASKDQKQIIPLSFEGQFTVVNSGFLDGIYKATGIVDKK